MRLGIVGAKQVSQPSRLTQLAILLPDSNVREGYLIVAETGASVCSECGLTGSESAQANGAGRSAMSVPDRDLRNETQGARGALQGTEKHTGRRGCHDWLDQSLLRHQVVACQMRANQSRSSWVPRSMMFQVLGRREDPLRLFSSRECCSVTKVPGRGAMATEKGIKLMPASTSPIETGLSFRNLLIQHYHNVFPRSCLPTRDYLKASRRPADVGHTASAQASRRRTRCPCRDRPSAAVKLSRPSRRRRE